MARNILSGAPSSVPGAPSRVPGTAQLPSIVGGLYTRIPEQPTGRGFAAKHRQQLRDVHGQFAGGFAFAWTGLALAGSRLEQFENDVHRSVQEAAEALKDEMVAYAQENAPWEDHPGENKDAREHLQGAVVWEPDGEHLTIFLGHGDEVFYGVFLETMQGGKFAIIAPTLHQFAPSLAGKIRTLK